jgi:DNA modification methylase
MPSPSALAIAPPLYRTRLGTAHVGDSLGGMQVHLKDRSVQLFLTSPPFALRRKKEYGNEDASDYWSWFRPFAEVMWDKLRDDGSLVLDLGGAWNKSKPTRSLYQFELLINLCRNLGGRTFHLAQEFFWHNPSKMPLPAQWVNVERVRVKDAVNVIWWLSKSEYPKADNRRVLKPYSHEMEQLLDRQSYNGGRRPGGARVNRETWKRRHAGAIPPNLLSVPHSNGNGHDAIENLLVVGGSESASRYHRACNALLRLLADNENVRELVRKHPARFPLQVPAFFISFLTEESDLIVDPFAGSNVTGQAAEEAGRRWIAFEQHRHYLEPSVARIDSYYNGQFEWLDETPPLLDALGPDELPS